MAFSLGRFGPDAWQDPSSRAYRIHMPHDTTVPAACEDAGCDQWRSGWETECDEISDPRGRLVADWIRSGASGRDFTEMQDVRRGTILTVFRFAARQRCFNEHRTRPGQLLVYSGGRRVAEHVSLSDLAEDYTEHAGRLAVQQEKG